MKGIKSKIIALILFLLIITSSLIFANIVFNSPHGDSVLGGFEGDVPKPESSNSLVKVTLEHDENCVVISKNPVYIEKSQDAVFEVVFMENYAFDNIENGSYYDGYVTVRTPIADTTASISSKLTTVY